MVVGDSTVFTAVGTGSVDAMSAGAAPIDSAAVAGFVTVAVGWTFCASAGVVAGGTIESGAGPLVLDFAGAAPLVFSAGAVSTVDLAELGDGRTGLPSVGDGLSGIAAVGFGLGVFAPAGGADGVGGGGGGCGSHDR